MSFRFFLIAVLTAAVPLAATAEPAESEEKSETVKEPLAPAEALVFPPMDDACEKDGERKADCKNRPEPPATPFDTLAFPALDPPGDAPSSASDDEDAAPEKR